MKTITRAVVVGLLGIASMALVARADDSLDDLKAGVEKLRKQAATLAEQGKKEEAQKLEREANSLREKWEHAAKERAAPRKEEGEGERATPEGKQQEMLRRLREEFERKRAAGASEEELAKLKEYIGKNERHLHAFKNKEGEPGREGKESGEAGARLAEAGKRVQHLRMAADNLRAAGAGDLAAQVMKQAEHMEQELRSAKQSLSAERGPRPEGVPVERLMAQITELRREVERLSAEVKELRSGAKK